MELLVRDDSSGTEYGLPLYMWTEIFSDIADPAPLISLSQSNKVLLYFDRLGVHSLSAVVAFLFQQSTNLAKHVSE